MPNRRSPWCLTTRVNVLTILLLALASVRTGHAERLHVTWHWHMEQPIYWPDQRSEGPYRYERAWASIVQTDGGAAHPANDLREIFGNPDRVAAYQWRPPGTISSITWAPEAGAHVSFSGGLIENIQSLAAAGGQLGYSSTWNSSYVAARSSTTTGGPAVPRCEMVMFPFHHPLLPLIDDAVVAKELELHALLYDQVWGTTVARSRGFFPPEMAFSTRLIPLLADVGIEWTFVSAEKLSRACADFPVVLGSGGINCDPPNRADQINAAQGDYERIAISRGCAPAEAVPFGLTPHVAQYIDPATGAVASIVVIPCSQSLGWEDGANPISVGRMDSLDARNDPSRPMLVVLAHDGDNFWGGGYSYYEENVPQLVGQLASAGYVPTVVERYLADHPVPASDLVHVEDGAWVNADGDFGSPLMLNWADPPRSASGQLDYTAGWSVDLRNWAVLTAATDRVRTAEQILDDSGQPVRIAQVLQPGAGSTDAERAWHFLLGGINSGFMYYGSTLDLEAKPGLASNEAIAAAMSVIGSGKQDQTGPTIWIPQRDRWNPGGLNFGSQYGYQSVFDDGDFLVWTLVDDVSGLSNVTLRYRRDVDGSNPLSSIDNETYAGGAEVGPWIDIPMSVTSFPEANIYGWSDVDFLEPASAIADRATAMIVDERSVLIDYYIEATDGRGNVTRSPIQHVWIGDGSGGGPGGGGGAEVTPVPLVAGETATITYDATDGPLAGAGSVRLHYGFDDWSTIVAPDPAMSPDGPALWQITVALPGSANQLDFVFTDGAGLWDSNNGADWHVAIEEGGGGFEMDGALDAAAILVAENAGQHLWAALDGTQLYVATERASGGDDIFLFVAGEPGALRSAPWAKAGSVAGWSAMLADEHDNDYHGWFNASASGPPAAAHASATGADVLEGTIDLDQLLGPEVDHLWFAVGPYETADGGSLNWSRQVPVSRNGDGTLDGDEYRRVERCDLSSAGCCPGDINDSGEVGFADLVIVLAAWGPCDDCPADVNDDGTVGFVDLLIVLENWGACGA